MTRHQARYRRAGLDAILLLAAALAGLGRPARAQAPLDPLPACALRLVDGDRFATSDVVANALTGAARWTAHTPWGGDFGDATFIDPGPNGPFAFGMGGLDITARKNAEGHWTSGLIAAADAHGKGWGLTYGYFEARMRLPPGPGTWPAFWLASLQPTDGTETSIELDVIEYYGQSTSGFQSAWHVWGKNNRQFGYKLNWAKVPEGSLVDSFHDYGVLVLPDTTTFYLDRRAIWQVKTPPEHRRPLYPLIDLALGSGYSITDTPNPSTLHVAWVYLYAVIPSQERPIGCDMD